MDETDSSNRKLIHSKLYSILSHPSAKIVIPAGTNDDNVYLSGIEGHTIYLENSEGQSHDLLGKLFYWCGCGIGLDAALDMVWHRDV